MSGKTWFITGASRGFGRIWAEAALERGDRVAVTARKLSSVSALSQRFGDAVLPIELDVTNRIEAQEAVSRAHAHFGKLDVVVNNAGYALAGMVEEADEAEVRAVFDTNYFGMLRVIQAALPYLREQGSGHIIGVSSAVGIIAPAFLGFYAATKWAVEALHESLAQEVSGFGIKVTLVEPGSYATEFGSSASMKIALENEAYSELRTRIRERLANGARGNPNATAAALLAIVDEDHPPLRFALGNSVLPMARGVYASRIEEWEARQPLSVSAQGN